MPFIENNVAPSLIRPQSHTGRISSEPQSLQQQSAASARPQSTNPAFVVSPADKLYSSPPPAYENFNTLRANKESLELDIREHRAGGLLLPLELSKETALMNVKRNEFEENTEGGQLTMLLRERRLQRPVIRCVNQTDDNLNVEGQPIAFPKRPQSELTGRGDSLSYATNNFKQTQDNLDAAKRLKDASNMSLQNIKQSRPLSSYGRELEKKVLTKNIEIPPRPDEKSQQEQKQTRYALNDWIVKSRAGNATNKSVRSQSEMELLEDNDKVEIKQSKSMSGEVVQLTNEPPRIPTHKDVVESIITTVDDILPIFECIKERIELEKILKDGALTNQERIDRLKEVFKARNVHFNYAEQYEAQLYGEAYYENLKARYSQLLKSSPDLIANTLLQSEFVYLTYDTPEVRRFITTQYLRKRKGDHSEFEYLEGVTENPYVRPNPRQNCYELLVCAYDQVNPNEYFTISSAGITEFEDSSRETSVMTMDEWAAERRVFAKVKEIRFFEQFLQRKAMFMWKRQVKAIRKTRAYASINRLSLQANATFERSMAEICYIIKSIIYDLPVANYKLYSFENVNQYLLKTARGNTKYKQEFYMHAERRVITLVDFVKTWNANLPNINEFLKTTVERVSEILLSVCRTVAQHIEARTLASNDSKAHGGANSASAILTAISNATTFNMAKIKSLIKATDCNLAETLLEKLIFVNQYILDLLFGVEVPQAVLQQAIGECSDDGEYSDSMGSDNREIINKFNKHTMSDKDYEKSLEQQPPTEYEQLLDFYETFDGLEQVSSEEAIPNLDIAVEIRFDRHSKRETIGGMLGANQGGITKLIRPENLYAYFEYTMKENVLEQINDFQHYFINVPLAISGARYPPYPLFHLQIEVRDSEFTAIPSEEDMIELLGDCLSEVATIFHRSIRPYSYPKLASFLSETTRTSNLNEYLGLSVKDALSENEDYIASIREIKHGIAQAYELIDNYCLGFNGIFAKFVAFITEFCYGQQETAPAVVSAEGFGMRFSNLLETIQTVLALWRQRTDGLANLLQYIAFPGLMFVSEFREQPQLDEEHEDTDSQPVAERFEIPDWNWQLYDLFKAAQIQKYALASVLLEAWEFQRRNAEFERFFIDLQILKVKRAILCFDVSTIELYEEFAPFMVYFQFFMRLTLPLSIIQTESLLTSRAIKHSVVLEEIPEIPDNCASDFRIPAFSEFYQCVFDASSLTAYNYSVDDLDLTEIRDKFLDERKTIKAVTEARREKAEIQRKLFLETQALMEQRIKSKNKRQKPENSESKQSDTVEQSEVTQSSPNEAMHDEESEVVDFSRQLEKHINDLLEFTPKISSVSDVSQLPASARQLYKYLYETQVDKRLLDTVKLIIEVYEEARGEVHIFRESERKLLDLYETGSELGILDETGSLKLDELSVSILKDVFGLDLDMPIKEAFKEFENEFEVLERNITNFTIKKPELYEHFRFNLVVLYIQLGSRYEDVLSDMLRAGFSFNIYIDALEYERHRSLVYCAETYHFNKGKQIADEEQLFMYLLLQNTNQALENDNIKFAMLEFEQYSEQLDELDEENDYFTRCLELFDSLDFNISTNVQKTELSFLSEFCTFICEILKRFWAAVARLQKLIQCEACIPLVLLNTADFASALDEIDADLRFVDEEMTKTVVGFEDVLKNIQFDQNGTIIASSVSDDYDSIFNFTTLKFLIFAYKNYLKQTQLMYNSAINIKIKSELDKILAYEKSDAQGQEIELLATYEQDPEIFHTISVDDIKFEVIARDTIAYYFERNEERKLVGRLVQEMRRPLRSFQIMRTIAFQPRHYQYICKMFIPTPDLAYETFITKRLLCKIPEAEQEIPLGDLLAADRENAYRKIFGPEGDGIVEILLYHVAVLPRREAVQKQLTAFKFEDSSVFQWELRDTYLDVVQKISQFEGGKPTTEYRQMVDAEQSLTEELARREIEPNEVKLCETDVEDAADQETITTKSEVFQTTLSTIQLHNDAAFQRQVEILLRRRKQKHINYKSVHSQLSKGGFFIEMDRFTCTISKLVLRGLFSQIENIEKVALNADAEYKLLSKLSGTRELIMSLRFKMLTFSVDNLRINYVSDPSNVIQTLNDELINLRSLNSQFRNLINTDIAIAISKLEQLEQQSQQTIETIKQIIETQIIAMELMPVFANQQGAICKALPEETRQFNRVFKQLVGLMQSIFESNGLAVKNCTDEVAKLLHNKIQPEFESIEKQVQHYLQQKRDNYARFYFLSNKLLCEFLNIQFAEQTLGPTVSVMNLALDEMFENIKQTDGSLEVDQDGQRRFIIKSVESSEGEVLTIVPFAIRGNSETWIAALQQKCQNALSDQIARCFAELLYFSRESMGVYGYETKSGAAKEAHEETEQFSTKLENMVQEYCAQTLSICFQAIIPFYFDNYASFYMFEKFNLTKEPLKRVHDVPEEEKEPRAAKESTEKDVAFNLYTFFEKTCQALLKQLRVAKGKVEYVKLQLTLLTAIEAAETLEMLRQSLSNVDNYCDFLTYYYDNSSHELYCVDFAQHAQESRNEQNPLARKLNYGYPSGQLYGMEYYGLQQRSFASEEIVEECIFVQHHMLATHEPLLLSGPTGHGKSLQIESYALYAGELLTQIECSPNALFAEFEAKLMGSCLNGTFLVFEDIDKLGHEVFSVLCIYLHEIQQGLRSYELQFQINGQNFRLLPTTAIFGTVGSQVHNKISTHFKVVQTVQPDVQLVVKKFLYVCGFYTYSQLAAKLAYFCQLLGEQYIPAESQFASFRIVKQYLIILQSTYQRWIAKFTQSQRLAHYFAHSKTANFKQQREEQNFFAFIEQYCVVYCIFKFFVPQFETKFEEQLLRNLIASVFSSQVVQMIDKDERATKNLYTSSIKNSILRTARASVARSRSFKHGGFGLSEQHAPDKELLFLQLVLTKNVLMHEVGALACENVFYGEADLFVSSAVDTQLLESGTNMVESNQLNTEQGSADALQVSGRSNVPDTRQSEHSESDSISGSGFEIMSQRGVENPEEMFNTQVQNIVNSYVLKNQMHEINEFINGLLKNAKLIVESQLNQYQEFEGAMWYRTAIIIKGKQYSGKTTLWKTSLDHSNDFIEIYPASLSEEELFGFVENGYFTDGIVPAFIRKVLAQQKEMSNPDNVSTLNLKFLVFNGYSENLMRLISAIDDTRYLILENGEFLRIPNNIRMIFEVETVHNIPLQFEQRCIIVGIEADYHVPYVHAWLKQLFPDEYNNYVQLYDFDVTTHELTKQPTDPEPPERYRKRTQEELRNEKLTALLHYGNEFLEIADFVAFMLAELRDPIDKGKCDIMQFIMEFELLYTVYRSLIAPAENVTFWLLMEKQVIFFAMFHIIECVAPEAEELFNQLHSLVFKPIFEVLVVPERIVRVSELFFDPSGLVPRKILEGALLEFSEERFALLKATELNQFEEGELATLFYDIRRDKLIVQTVVERRIFAETVLCYATLESGSFQLLSGHDSDYYNELLFNSIVQGFEKARFAVGEQTSLQEIKEFFLSLFNSSGDLLLPLEEVPVIVHLFGLDSASFEVLAFLRELLSSGAEFSRDGLYLSQRRLIEFKIVGSAAVPDAFLSFPRTVCEHFPEYDSKSQRETIVESTNIWSNDKFRASDQEVFPVFHHLQRFILDVHTEMAAVDDYSFDKMMDFLRLLFKTDQTTFADEISAFYDPSFAPKFKRGLFEATVCILNLTVFSDVDPRMSRNIIAEAVEESQLFQEIVELKTQASLRLPTKYHPDIFLAKEAFTVHFTIPSFSSAETAEAFFPGYPISTTKFIEAEFSPRYNELHSIAEKLPADLPKFPDVACSKPLLSYIDTEMVEIRHRILQFNHTISNYGNLVAVDRPGYETRYLLLKLAMRYNYKLHAVGDKLDDNQNSYNTFVISLQMVICEVIASAAEGQVQNYLLVVSDEYLRNPKVVRFLQQLFYSRSEYALFSVESGPLHTLVQALRNQYDQEGLLTDLQLKEYAFDIITNHIKLILTPEIDTLACLKSLRGVCRVENVQMWSLNSVCFVSLQDLPAQFIEMRKLCSNERILDMFQQTFKQVVQALSVTAQYRDILLSPNFFTRFLCCYHSVYFTKRTQLQRQKTTYSKGLELFSQSAQTLEKIEVDLAVIKPKLELLQTNTELLLTELNSQKQDIETRTREVKIEEKALQLKSQQIEEELAQAQLELDEVMPILDRAEEALKQITRQEIAEIASFINPKQQIVMVMSAICIVLGENANWQAARQLMSSGNLVTQLLMIKPLEIPAKQMKQFKQMLANEQFEVDKIQQISLAASLLANWCISVVAYCDAYEHIQPRIDRLNSAKRDYEESVSELEKRKREIVELTMAMNLVEQQLNKALHEKDQYEKQMRVLEERQSIVKQLNGLLDIQHAQWKEQLEKSSDEMEKLSVLSLLAAVYTLVQFSSGYNTHEETLTRFVREELGFTNVGGITASVVYEFVAGQHLESVWKASGFFGDNVIFRGMFALNNLAETPYIVDPDLVFIGAAQAMQLLILNFEDERWMEVFVRAVGQPRTIVLQTSDVLQVPNLVKSVMRACCFSLDRMFTDETKFTRTIELTVNDVRIDVNEHLQFVIVDNEAKAAQNIRPEVLAQFQIVSFVKDEQSLAEQIANVIIDAQNSDIETQRIEAIKNQAAQEIQLNNIETQIVETLLVFDFSKDLDNSKSTIIPELQNAITLKQQLLEKLARIEAQTEQLKNLRVEQMSSAKYLSYLYLAILDYYPHYRLAEFNVYIRTFIADGIQVVVDNIMMSIEQEYQKFVVFQVICQVDQERFFNPVLLKACQQAIIKPDPLIVFDPNTQVFKHSHYEITDFASDESQLMGFLRGQGEKAFDFMQRCCGICYLLKGVFKELQAATTVEPEISRDSLFYTYFVARVVGCPDLPESSSDLCPELQYEIVFALQTKWKSHFLELFSQMNINEVCLREYRDIYVPEFFAIIYHLCHDIVQRTKDFNGLNAEPLVIYLAILFTKLLKPEYFDILIDEFIALHKDEVPYFQKQVAPDDILAHYVSNFTSSPLFIQGPQIASLTLINGKLEQYKVVTDDIRIKPEEPQIFVTSLQISTAAQLLEALSNELQPEWLILVNFDFSNEDDLEKFYDFQLLCQQHGKQLQSDSRIFLLGQEDIFTQNLQMIHETRLASLPKLCIQSSITAEECKEQLTLLSAEIPGQVDQKIAAKIATQFLAFFVSGQYGNIEVKIAYSQFQYFKSFYNNLVFQQSLQKTYSNKLITNRLSQMFGSTLSKIQLTHISAIMHFASQTTRQITAEDPETIGLPTSRIMDYYKRTSHNNLRYHYKQSHNREACAKQELIEMPLNQFLMLEEIPFEQYINLKSIRNIPQFLLILELQASAIFGYAPSDYRIVFSTEPAAYNDIVLCGLNFYNTDRQITQLKVLATLHYKRRDLFLPLLTVPKLEKSEKTKNLKLALPASRFSEFSLGSMGDVHEQEIQLKAPEKPVKERRLAQYLMSQCKVCEHPIELRRNGVVVGSICVDFGEGSELELNGVYCDV